MRFGRSSGAWRALTCLALATAVSVSAGAATFRLKVSQAPSVPLPGQAVRIWMNSDTAFGETAGVEYEIAGSYTKVLGTFDNTSFAGANWYVDIPAQVAGTLLTYQLFTQNELGSDYGFTGFNWAYTVFNANPLKYTLAGGFNVLDTANDSSGTILANAATTGILAATSGQERGVAIRPATGTMPALAYLARGGVSTGDRPAGVTGVAVVALAELGQSKNPGVPAASSNYIDTGLVTSSTAGVTVSFVQDITYDQVTDRVFFIDRAGVAPNVFSIPGGTLGGAGLAGGAIASPNAAAVREFIVTNDGGAGGAAQGGTGRGIAVRTIAGVTYIAAGVGNHFELWTGAPGGSWSRVWSTLSPPSAATVAAGRISGSQANSVAIDAAGNVYCSVNGGRTWRFPGSLPSGATSPVDVDDRALGGTNSGASAIGIPLVENCPIGPLTPSGAVVNQGNRQSVEHWQAGSDQGLFQAVIPAAGARSVARMRILGEAVASNGAPYVNAVIDDAVGSGANAGTQDSIMASMVLKQAAGTTQPGGTTQGLLYTQAIMNPDGSGFLFGNAAIKDTANYPNVTPSKVQSIPTFALWQAGIPALGGELSISNQRAFATSARSGYVSWETNEASTTRILRGQTLPALSGAASDVDVANRSLYHQVAGAPQPLMTSSSNASHAAGATVYSRLLSWKEGYRSAVADVSYKCLSVEATAAVKSSPATYAGVAYVGADDGLLYAMDLTTGEKPAGSAFPFDAKANGATAASKILGRPSVRFLEDGVPYVFFTTSDAYVFCLKLDGTKVWSAGPLVSGATACSTTPAIMRIDDAGDPAAKDYAFVAAGNGASAQVFKLVAATGAVISTTSPVLGLDILSSPAIAGMGVYVGVSGGIAGDIVRLSPYDLMPFAGSVAAGETVTGSPFIYLGGDSPFAYPVMYAGTAGGNLYALNAINGQPLDGAGGSPLFGTDGKVALGGVLGNAYGYKGLVFVPSADNNVFAVKAGDGAGWDGSNTLFFDAGAGGSVSGVAVDPEGNITGSTVGSEGTSGVGTVCFGSTNGHFYQVKLTDPTTYLKWETASPATGKIGTTPAIDPGTGYATVGADDKLIYRFPRM